MKTHRTNIVAIIFSFVMGIAYSPSHAAERFSASVQVVVTGDEQLKNETASYIRRELRSLNDVVIVDSGADWVIELLIAELTNGIGAKLGLAISVTIIPTFNNQVLESTFNPQYRDMGMKLTANLIRYPHIMLRTGGPNELQSICKKIVAAFDTKHIETSRTLFQNIQSIK